LLDPFLHLVYPRAYHRVRRIGPRSRQTAAGRQTSRQTTAADSRRQMSLTMESDPLGMLSPAGPAEDWGDVSSKAAPELLEVQRNIS
jgi:hypothetical protein